MNFITRISRHICYNKRQDDLVINHKPLCCLLECLCVEVGVAANIHRALPSNLTWPSEPEEVFKSRLLQPDD